MWRRLPDTDYKLANEINSKNLNSTERLSGYTLGNITLIIASLLAFSPLFFGFLVPFVKGDTSTGLLSTLLFVAFIIALISKLAIQSYLFQRTSRLVANTEVQNSPTLTQFFEHLRKSYTPSVLKTVILLSGLIPILQLLTIWIAVPVGLSIALEYADLKFFKDIDQYLRTITDQKTSLPLDALYIPLILFYVSIPLLLAALWYGLQSLNL